MAISVEETVIHYIERLEAEALAKSAEMERIRRRCDTVEAKNAELLALLCLVQRTWATRPGNVLDAIEMVIKS
jgi:hypothetical protein